MALFSFENVVCLFGELNFSRHPPPQGHNVIAVIWMSFRCHVLTCRCQVNKWLVKSTNDVSSENLKDFCPIGNCINLWRIFRILEDFQIFRRFSDFWKIFRFLDNPRTCDIWDTDYNSNNWQSLLSDNQLWHWTAFAILAMFLKPQLMSCSQYEVN